MQFLGGCHTNFKWISSFYQVLKELFSIVEKIWLNFQENFGQFFKKLYPIFKRILHLSCFTFGECFARVFKKYITQHETLAIKLLFLLKFQIFLMPRKNELWNPLTFWCECQPWYEMLWNVKKMMQNMRKKRQNTSLYNVHFSHFVSVSRYSALNYTYRVFGRATSMGRVSDYIYTGKDETS